MVGDDAQAPTGDAGGTGRGSARWWLMAAIAVPWVAGILLIDDETAQTIFVVGLVVALVGGDAILSRRRGEKAGAGDDDAAVLIVPLILAVLVANVFSSDDAERAALVPLAIVFVALWRLARGRRRRGPTVRPL